MFFEIDTHDLSRLRDLSLRMALSLSPAPAEAARLRECVHSTDSSVMVRYCRTIFCPECWYSTAQNQRGVVLKPLCAQTLHTVCFLTVTAQDCPPDELHQTIEALSKGFNKAFSRCRRILGYHRVIEVAPSKHNVSWERAHIHAVLVLQKGRSIDRDWAESKWIKAVGKLASTVYVSLATNSDDIEAGVRYAIKSNARDVADMWEARLDDNPARWVKVLEQIKGTHVYASKGVLKPNYHAGPVSQLAVVMKQAQAFQRGEGEITEEKARARVIACRRNKRIQVSRRDYLLKPLNRPIPMAD